MLHVKLGKVLEFAPRSDIDLSLAMEKFSKYTSSAEWTLPEEIIVGMFGEWLLFEYKGKGKQQLIKQYYLLNPDKLPRTDQSELKQIIESQSLYLLQVYSTSKPPFVFLQSIFTGEVFKVYDQAFSIETSNQEGGFFGRLAKVGEHYYLVGSNPLRLPVRYTPRAIRIFSNEKTSALDLKAALRLIFSSQNQSAKKVVNVKQKRINLGRKYLKIVSEYHLKTEFDTILKLIYNEKYTHNFADYITDLVRLGIPEEVYLEKLKFFQDIWNFFPHKCLKDKCPAELYRENML